MRAHEVGVRLDLLDPLQGRRGHADSDGGQGVVAIERLGVGPPLAALRIGEDSEALGAHLGDGVARDALGFVGFLDAQEAIHHPQHVDAVALVIRRLQAVVRDFPLGFEHLGRIARQLEERGALEVERLLAKDGGRRAPLGDHGECEEDHESLHGWPLPATRASALPDLGSDPIDPFLALDPGGRGIARFFQTGGARRAADALRRARRVVLTTGFVVDTGVAETDGPPGAAVLGRALRALGAEVRYVTDIVTAPVLMAALTALGETADVIAWPDGDDAARRLLGSERPTHLVAIERPGRARDGTYRNMRGADVSEWNAPIDELFVRAGRVTTVGVGDGGNEIGMGNVRARLAKGGGL